MRVWTFYGLVGCFLDAAWRALGRSLAVVWSDGSFVGITDMFAGRHLSKLNKRT